VQPADKLIVSEATITGVCMQIGCYLLLILIH